MKMISQANSIEDDDVYDSDIDLIYSDHFKEILNTFNLGDCVRSTTNLSLGRINGSYGFSGDREASI